MYKKCMQFYYHSALINNPGNSKKKKNNSQLIFKLWKISNYENKKKNVNKFGLPLCVIRKVKSHKWQGNNLQKPKNRSHVYNINSFTKAWGWQNKK